MQDWNYSVQYRYTIWLLSKQHCCQGYIVRSPDRQYILLIVLQGLVSTIELASSFPTQLPIHCGQKTIEKEANNQVNSD